MITLEVISRYVFSFSIPGHRAARLLRSGSSCLAGVAMRHGAHVGLSCPSALSLRRRRAVVLLGLF
jgi:hypothetical protein